MSPPARSRALRWSCPRCLSRDPGQAVSFALGCSQILACTLSPESTSLILDRNCCGRLRVSPVAVLLSTLQLSKYMTERLFRSFQSTQALLHISGIVSSVYLSIITIFTKTPVACYFRQNDLLWIICVQKTQ